MQSVDAVGRDIDCEPIALKSPRQGIGERGFVLDHQHPHRVRPGSVSAWDGGPPPLRER